ncbi:hypothetical protein ACRDU6_13190 [Mycolicibacterium sp. ELW1]|uniref:hypothetical protein n=1 Tax=Mycobacteriaceae TaxID=1762 RepID=UPI0011EF8EE3|nr:hypothetical protein [Mycobacterium sp. ELW1]QEN13496.1 hypothetical protein D3H54_09740 [Mycobacterium sp. ELW1]
MGFSAWLGVGALTVGIGAAALAGSGTANAEAGTGSSARQHVSASHPVRPAAHNSPRPKTSATLLAASAVTGVADPKPRPVAAAVIRHTTTISAPPTAHATAVPNITDLLGRIVMLGSDIQHFNVVRAVHRVEHAVSGAIRSGFTTVAHAVESVVASIGSAVIAVVFIVALPVEIPLAFYLFVRLVNSPLWF